MSAGTVSISPSRRRAAASALPTSPQGVSVVVDRLTPAGVTRVVLELIGVYGQRLVRALAEAGFEVGVVDPEAHQGAAPGGRQAGQDRQAGRHADCALRSAHERRRPTVPDCQAFKLRALSTRRRQLVEMIAMEKTRLKQALDAEIVEASRPRSPRSPPSARA